MVNQMLLATGDYVDMFEGIDGPHGIEFDEEGTAVYEFGFRMDC